jgi:hypothetical protein
VRNPGDRAEAPALACDPLTHKSKRVTAVSLIVTGYSGPPVVVGLGELEEYARR